MGPNSPTINDLGYQDVYGSVPAPNTPTINDAAYLFAGTTAYNVRARGAKGDGTTDDSAAFKSAVTAATAANGFVFVPHGTYILNPDTIGVITCPLTGESMFGTTLKLVSGYGGTNNLIRVVSVNNVLVGNFTIDGNKANISGGNQYGLYISTTNNSGAFNVLAKNWQGVGIHYYNNTRAIGENLWSTGNFYHGLEFEQNVKGTFTNLHGYSNTLHGILVDPGEVSGTGSKGNTFTNVQCDNNSQYGLAFNAANGDISAWLSEGDVFNNVSLTNNSQYGLNIYKQDKQTFNGLYIANNGFFGIYLFESQYNTFNGLFMHNNSQAGNGSYDEILVEGYSSNNAHPSLGNTFNGGTILIDGTTKARYCFNEGTANDGPNTFVNMNVPNIGTAGDINSLNTHDVITMPGGVVQIADIGRSISGANAGFDSAFSHILRLYNNFTTGSTQIVTPNGNVQFYVGGNNTFNVESTSPHARPDSGTIAGGALAISIGNTSQIGIYFGSGAPTISAPKGSLYLRTDGSSTSTRMYVNTDASTTWTNVTTGA